MVVARVGRAAAADRLRRTELGLAYVFITHNIGVVEYVADRIAVMRNGRLVEQGDCASVLSRPPHPYTGEVLAAVPRLSLA